MAFNNGFSGDVRALPAILKTLEVKTVLIPGITANADLMISAKGELATFHTRSSSTVASGNVGDIVNYAAKGTKRIDVPMTQAFTIGAIIPQVNRDTVSVDVITDKAVQESIEIANAHNKAGLTAILAAAVAKTYLNGSDAFDAVAQAIAEFKTDNAKSGLRPTGMLVSPAFYARLLSDKRFIQDTTMPQEGYVGKVGGVPVVESADLEVNDFVLVNAVGVVAPINVNTLVVVDATTAGYPNGTLVAGELGFGFKIVTKADDATLDQVKGYLVSKYIQAGA